MDAEKPGVEDVVVGVVVEVGVGVIIACVCKKNRINF
jgi:hypothetical protein